LLIVDRMLDSGISLSWDREVARDLVGTFRTLVALDPAVIERLENHKTRSIPGSARARLVQAALAGLAAPAALFDDGGITPGHDWTSPPFVLGRGYER